MQNTLFFFTQIDVNFVWTIYAFASCHWFISVLHIGFGFGVVRCGGCG